MYTPRNVPTDPKLIPNFLEYELRAISRDVAASIYQANEFGLITLYAQPSKIIEGMIVKADGTTWNPGLGAGLYVRIGSAWVSLSRTLESFVVACGDESTAMTVGTAKTTFRMPYAFTLTSVRASVTTSPTGSTIIFDINESGTTVLSTKLSIDASEKTSTTAASAAVISDSALADDAEITIDFDQVGSTIAGTGPKVTLIGYRV